MLSGIDWLSTGQAVSLRRRLRTSRVGLLSHRAATDRHGRGSFEVLDELGATISLVLTPEHGFDGIAQAEEPVSVPARGDDVCPMFSLYGQSLESLSPTDEQLSMMDLLVIDLVDVGSRYYTYVWTALLALRAAARRGVHTVVLDRPNP
ncbi:MAG TPA: exo-beta-N-acetylmuramidase NamZ domain-containing protein, partial [Polyangiaceae bacterium]